MQQFLASLPIPAELTQQLAQLSSEQQAFLSGYLWATSQGVNGVVVEPSAVVAPARKITVISASQTGNAASIAKQLTDGLSSASLDVSLVSAGSYKARQLAKEDIVVIVTSTQGEGEPPEEAVPLHHFLFGKKAPNLSDVSFAVFGLGDSSYPDFCKAAVDFDSKMAELGAKRLLDPISADLDFQATADAWVEQAVEHLEGVAGSGAVVDSQVSANDALHIGSQYNKDNPYAASLIQRHSLATEDADKAVAHIEIDLGDSGITYQAGDALGVLTNNDPEAVADVLELTGLTGNEEINTRLGKRSLRQALIEQSDLNQLTPQYIAGYAETAGHERLNSLVSDKAELRAYQAWTPLIGLLHEYPQQLDAQRLYDGLKPLTPRLYSIASAQAEVGDEVHLCVGLVDIPLKDKTYRGSASGLLSGRLDDGDEIRVFVEPNPNYRLPTNPDTPIIMIGAGTGIAPYRGFLQQRSADGAGGKNWLIFGNRHYRRDFLYQAEWIDYREQGFLHETSLAWSRDADEKVYVQEKIRTEAEKFWSWLQDGAHIYVCGDATRMARDVEKAILAVISERGQMSDEDAAEYLNELREAGRYQRDVY
ncbi:MAG: assimilatory sulfite reductase (NADPH) flavoprotein subunit [Pseudomonadota bacterium]